MIDLMLMSCVEEVPTGLNFARTKIRRVSDDSSTQIRVEQHSEYVVHHTNISHGVCALDEGDEGDEGAEAREGSANESRSRSNGQARAGGGRAAVRLQAVGRAVHILEDAGKQGVRGPTAGRPVRVVAAPPGAMDGLLVRSASTIFDIRYLIRPPVIARVTFTTYIGRTTISTTTVQGGIDPPENPLMAAHRELEEETGIRKELVRVVTSLDAWLDYEHPTFSQGVEYRGQTQKWVLLEFLGGDEDVDLCHLGEDAREFEEWRWMRLEEVADGVVWFKKGVYREVYERFGAYLL